MGRTTTCPQNEENMKISELNPSLMKYISGYLETALLHLSIKTDIKIEVLNNRHGREYLHVMSSDIMCSPMMFKRVYIDGKSELLPVESYENVYEFCLQLYYRFETFDFGSNGVMLGETKFRIFVDSSGHQTLDFLGLTIMTY